MPVLSVPYYIQPTNNWCQSTCMLMVSDFVRRREPNPSPAKAIGDIHAEINGKAPPATSTRPARPSHERNAWKNFAWWLDGDLGASMRWTHRDTSDATEFQRIVRSNIDRGMPLMVGVVHARTPGHVILVVGYEDIAFELAGERVRTTWYVCHDPFGDKDRPRAWGDSRVVGKGQNRVKILGRWAGKTGSLPSHDFPGQEGPGKGVLYGLKGVSRALEERYDALGKQAGLSAEALAEEYAFRYLHSPHAMNFAG